MRQRLVAILSADAAGYSRLMADEELGTIAALDAGRDVFRTEIESQQGRVIDMAGDSVLASFEAAIGAVQAALRIQERLNESAAPLSEDRRMRFRIGVHVGDIRQKDDGTIYGDGVNVAARLQALAEPGGVVISGATQESVRHRLQAAFEDLGEQSVKNIPHLVRAFRVHRATGHENRLLPRTGSGGTVTARPVLNSAASALLGRDDELRLALELLQAHRLVTICGPGGIGKTRLAHALMQAARPHLAGEGGWVELAPLDDGTQVPAAVAQALGLRIEGGGDPAATVHQALARRTLLLVLDNCEHLAAACATFVRGLLDAAPAVRVVATGQQPLKLREEQLLRLGPLALPAAQAEVPSALQSGAVCLFVERVRRLQPRFALDDGNVAATIDICRGLDGVPLALELAAARVPLLGVVGVCDRLRERLRLLGDRQADAPARQRTLHAALDWSHALLPPEAQTVLRRLAVFSGGFSVEAAQQVASDERLDAWAVLDQLSLLAEHSLVDIGSGEASRCGLLETTRAYAQERLAASGEAAVVVQRHARWLAAHFERLEEALFAGRMSDDAFIAARAEELDNLRTALASSLRENDLETALDLIVRSAPFGFLLPPGNGIAETIDRLQERISDAQKRAWLHYAGRHYLRLDWAGIDAVEARRAVIAALKLIPEPKRRAFACCMLAQEEARHPDGPQWAQSLLAEAQALERPDWPRWLRMRRLLAHGMCFGYERVSASAGALLREIEAAGEGGGRSAFMLREMQAWALLDARREDEAVPALEALRERGRREKRDSHRMWVVLENLAKALLDCDRPADTLPVLKELLQHLGCRSLHAGSAFVFAEYASSVGRDPDAARLLGFEQTMSRRDGRLPTPRDERIAARTRARLEAAHGAAALDAWLKDGAALDEAAARALFVSIAEGGGRA